MFTEKQSSKLDNELKSSREYLAEFIHDISRQMGVILKCIVAIESDNMSFFVGTNHV